MVDSDKVISLLVVVGLLVSAARVQAAPVSETHTFTVTVTIPQCLIVTEMRVMPRVLELDCPEGEPPVHIRLDLPSFLKCSDLHLDTIQLNGVPISPVEPPTKWRGDKDPTRCHIFFDRQEVVDILGPPPGHRVIQFQAEICAGHLISAADTVTLLPGPPACHGQDNAANQEQQEVNDEQ